MISQGGHPVLPALRGGLLIQRPVRPSPLYPFGAGHLFEGTP